MGIIINSRPTLKSGPVSKVACLVNSANIATTVFKKFMHYDAVLALYRSTETLTIKMYLVFILRIFGRTLTHYKRYKEW